MSAPSFTRAPATPQIEGHEILLPRDISVSERLASLESVFHSAPIGLCTVDLDFRYVSANECFARMYELSPSDFLGRTVWEVLPEPAPQIVEHYRHALQVQTIVQREIHLQRPSREAPGEIQHLTYLRTAQPVRDPAGTIVGIAVALFDLTTRREMEAALRASEEKLRYTVELSPHFTFTASAEGGLTFLSPRWYQVTGLRPGASLHEDWLLGVHRDDSGPLLEKWMQVVQSNGVLDENYRVLCAGTHWRWHRARAFPRFDEANRVILWYGTIEDVHDRKLAEDALQAKTLRLEEVTAQLERLAREDHLTSLANRRTFDHLFGKEIDRARRANLPLALLLADVDHFKRFNDTYGHPAGDAVLREVAQAIAGGIRRPGDLAARFGGEEFAVILPNTVAEGAVSIARKINEAVRHLSFPQLDAEPSGVTISIGVAMLSGELDRQVSRDLLASRLLNAADKALYQAKATGRDRVLLA